MKFIRSEIIPDMYHSSVIYSQFYFHSNKGSGIPGDFVRASVMSFVFTTGIRQSQQRSGNILQKPLSFGPVQQQKE